MKKNRNFTKTMLFVCAFIMLFTLVCSANGTTKQKIVMNYNSESHTLDLNYYIDEGSAIVGYCNFVYDSSVLTLLDKNGSPVPNEIPKTSSHSDKTYLTDVISTYNNVEVTDVGKGADNLIDTDQGHLFFAWLLPNSTPFIDASNTDVLIASASFKVNDDIEAQSLNPECIRVATKEDTSGVSGWFSGLVVLNKEQKRYTYDGESPNSALFASELVIGESVITPEDNSDSRDGQSSYEEPDSGENDNKDEEQLPEENAAPNESTAPDEDISAGESDADDGSEASEEDTDVNGTTAPDENEETDENTGDSKNESQSDNKNNTPASTVPDKAICLERLDFSLSADKTTDSLRVKWEKPLSLGEVTSYTVTILDSEYDTVKEIAGISGVSSSYTASGLLSGTDYKIYLVAKTASAKVSSEIINVSTDDEADAPTTVVSNVFYDAGEGHLFGLSSELVVFGEHPAKVPEIIPQSGKYFVGWTNDGSELVDIYSDKIYSDTIYSAVYSSKKPCGAKTFINGYEDGTFKPEGNITRAEAATLISRLCDEYDNNSKYSHSFSDCEEGLWYENPVAFCQSKGHITGYEDGTFRPYGSITRAEFATILFRVFGFEGANGINVFSDLDGHWGKNNISVLYSVGIVKPYSDGSFEPDSMLTRQDAVVMINKCLGNIPDRTAIIESIRKNGYKFTDVPQYSDCFFDIMTAVMN